MAKLNVLIVDDEALLRQGLRSMLEKESIIGQIFEADDEEGFLTHLTSQSVDIVLLDIRLRKLSGLE